MAAASKAVATSSEVIEARADPEADPEHQVRGLKDPAAGKDDDGSQKGVLAKSSHIPTPLQKKHTLPNTKRNRADRRFTTLRT